MKSKSLVLLSVALMTACSVIPESKKVDYKSAGKLPPLDIPPDLVAPGRDDRYAVPDVGKSKGSASYSTYSAERLGQAKTSSSDVLPEVGKIHIERSGSERWIVAPMTPDQLWPLLKEFWQETGFVVDVEKPEAGVMETDWAENRAKIPLDFLRGSLGGVFDTLYSTAERDKYRTRIEAGSTAGTTEIYISHRGMYEVYVNEGKSDTRWEPRPPDPDLEAEMLRRLMVKLGADNAQATAQLAASKTLQDKAKLTGRSGDSSGQLEIQESFDRAWRRVGLALDRVGFTVEDRDRSQGLYFVRYVPPESEMEPGKKDDKGFLSRMMFWKSDSSSKTANDSKFRILVKGSGSNTVVQVMTREGGVDTSDSARKILALLFDQLK